MEEDESVVSLDYDHISDLVQPGSFNIFWIILRKNNIICFIYLVESHVVTSFFCKEYICSCFPKGNEWGTDYWLEHCLEGKHTLNVSIIDFEGSDFLIGSMVIKGEYFTLDERT